MSFNLIWVLMFLFPLNVFFFIKKWIGNKAKKKDIKKNIQIICVSDFSIYTVGFDTAVRDI